MVFNNIHASIYIYIYIYIYISSERWKAIEVYNGCQLADKYDLTKVCLLVRLSICLSIPVSDRQVMSLSFGNLFFYISYCY